ncbi:MAG: hypothetical protein JJE25_06435 [Bacteroidia bacterium]|nr:hypothetical protein [Bacteroidia bacterium]
MHRFLLFAITIFSVSDLYAQLIPPCIDSLLRPANPYFVCYDSYNPVCGCDSITYRNDCFAYSKAGLNYRRPGICNNQLFGIDLVPNPVQIEPAIFSIAIRAPSTALIYITDIFGATIFSRNIYTYYSDEIKSFEIDMNNYRNGVYALIVVVQGDKKFIKFVKTKN